MPTTDRCAYVAQESPHRRVKSIARSEVDDTDVFCWSIPVAEREGRIYGIFFSLTCWLVYSIPDEGGDVD